MAAEREFSRTGLTTRGIEELRTSICTALRHITCRELSRQLIRHSVRGRARAETRAEAGDRIDVVRSLAAGGVLR